jgi:hypothetical protein
MLPRCWVASTKPEVALVRSQGLFSLGKGEGGIWRRVIAGQKRRPHCLEGHSKTLATGYQPAEVSFRVDADQLVGVELDDAGVELLERVAELEIPVDESLLKLR